MVAEAAVQRLTRECGSGLRASQDDVLPQDRTGCRASAATRRKGQTLLLKGTDRRRTQMRAACVSTAACAFCEECAAPIDGIQRLVLQPSSGESYVDAGCGGAGGEDNFECILAPLSSTSPTPASTTRSTTRDSRCSTTATLARCVVARVFLSARTAFAVASLVSPCPPCVHASATPVRVGSVPYQVLQQLRVLDARGPRAPHLQSRMQNPFGIHCRSSELAPSGLDLLQVPWPITRGPSYWEERLTEHYRQRGVSVNKAFTRHGLLQAMSLWPCSLMHRPRPQ
jgi:hypothetical protein